MLSGTSYGLEGAEGKDGKLFLSIAPVIYPFDMM